MAALQRQFPDSVAFLNAREENDLAAHCADVAKGNGFTLWGLDQEFLGSAGWILSRMLATGPGPKALQAIRSMQADEQTAIAEAAASGKTEALYLEAATDLQIAAAASAIEVDGTPETQRLFHELTESRVIYRENAAGMPDANARRARLLKRNFLAAYNAAGGDARPQRVLVKMGDYHIYRGFNVLHQRDLGNFLAEKADIHSTQSLHIMILGVHGEYVVYDGYQRPLKHLSATTVDVDAYRWLKPAVDARVQDAADRNTWTLYDLRKLRFGGAAGMATEWERVVYGYDLLVLIPEVTPADLMR